MQCRKPRSYISKGSAISLASAVFNSLTKTCINSSVLSYHFPHCIYKYVCWFTINRLTFITDKLVFFSVPGELQAALPDFMANVSFHSVFKVKISDKMCERWLQLPISISVCLSLSHGENYVVSYSDQLQVYKSRFPLHCNISNLYWGAGNGWVFTHIAWCNKLYSSQSLLRIFMIT